MSINIIWDFDGVIADSEVLWVENRRQLLNKRLGINWDIETAFKHIGGMSDATKAMKLEEMGIKTDEDFWKLAIKMDYESLNKQSMTQTPGIINILEDNRFGQCIATGGSKEETKNKLKYLNLEKFFDENNVFTAEMVRYGKPEPDLFLLAQEIMGWKKEECVIIEDSMAGVVAGTKAGIKTIAFGGNVFTNKEKYALEALGLGAYKVIDNMKDVKKFLDNL